MIVSAEKLSVICDNCRGQARLATASGGTGLQDSAANQDAPNSWNKTKKNKKLVFSDKAGISSKAKQAISEA